MDIRTKTTMTPRMYLVFCRTYYAQRFKAVRRIMTVIGAVLVIAGFYCFYNIGQLAALICLWVGVFLCIYPRLMHRKTYKEMKNKAQTLYFKFTDGGMRVKVGGERTEHRYEDLKSVVERKNSFVIICGKDSGVMVDKRELSPEEIKTLSDAFKRSAPYKYSKK
ncbi:MAG: YcxB family protein [Clostridiales bacterium]|nr:YcxB family protein [Clostridiales bacterium]